MGLITASLVDRVTGRNSVVWLDPIAGACSDWDVNTPRQVSMFLATCAHESAGFRRLIENMKYSAAGLRRTWPHRFSAEDAKRMAYDEEAIAERAYGGRMGNGPEGSGDGFKYRGHGIIQVTGRKNMLMMGEHLGGDFIAEPELLLEPLWAAYAAACFWEINGCNAAAEEDDFERICRIVNGGLNGLEDRLNWLGVIERAMQ